MPGRGSMMYHIPTYYQTVFICTPNEAPNCCEETTVLGNTETKHCPQPVRTAVGYLNMALKRMLLLKNLLRLFACLLYSTIMSLRHIKKNGKKRDN